MGMIADITRPCMIWDAILQHVASWGDRNPHIDKLTGRGMLSSLRPQSLRPAEKHRKCDGKMNVADILLDGTIR
jgi:hypothetical protein